MNANETRRVFEAAPFINHLGIELVSCEAGRCETRLTVTDTLLQQDGVVHAGVQATMADHTAGAAAASLVQADQMVLTAEFNISLLRAGRGDTLRCVAQVLKAGSRMSVVESEVYCERRNASTMIAKAKVCLAVVPKARRHSSKSAITGA
jgi:uncharacterized protein (TIGR00369 family)